MSERKVLIRHHVFVKKVFQQDPADWLVDLNLTFQPDEMHVKSVVCWADWGQGLAESEYEDPNNPGTMIPIFAAVSSPHPLVNTIYMEGIGDICCVGSQTDRVANYIFNYGSTAKNFAKFEIRNTEGKNITQEPLNTLSLIMHLEFIKYA